jgi:hypothetical protein
VSLTITIKTGDGVVEFPPLTTAQAKEVYRLLAEIFEESHLPPAPQVQGVLPAWSPAPPHKMSSSRTGAVPLQGVIITCGAPAAQTSGSSDTTATQADYSQVTLTNN